MLPVGVRLGAADPQFAIDVRESFRPRKREAVIKHRDPDNFRHIRFKVEEDVKWLNL